MSKQGAAAREDITFEKGYEELKGIVARLNAEDVSVHEMFEGFRRGKGLEQALRGYLSEREGELTEIEQGNNLPEFNIVAPADTPTRKTTPKQAASTDSGFLAARSTPAGGDTLDSEIPF